MHRASDMGMKKAHPKLSDEKLSSGQFNTSVLVSFCLLLFWTGASGVVIAASSLFLQQACGDVGLDPAISNRNGSDGGCFDNKSNSTQHDLYTRAQSGAATSLFAFTVVTGIASLLSCPAFGALADAQGRKVALCITLLCACLSNLTVAVLQVRTYMLIAVGAFNFGGGPYAVVGTAFSVIADVSPTLPVKIRAKIFGRVEACLWFGLLIGPVATGAIVDRFGSRHAFVFLAIPSFVAACLILTCFAETLVLPLSAIVSSCRCTATMFTHGRRKRPGSCRPLSLEATPSACSWCFQPLLMSCRQSGSSSLPTLRESLHTVQKVWFHQIPSYSFALPVCS
eukprot:m.408837 g.408837  ORF g.408837 m.408837 type:complete len:339 (-) comp21238_c0_seq13:747-1763(-)